MNGTWKIRKKENCRSKDLFLIRRSGISQYPVRDYRSVEKEYTALSGMPSGMQPGSCKEVAFLRNADFMCGYNFLPSDIPYGNGAGGDRIVLDADGNVRQVNNYYPFGMPFAETSVEDQGVQPYKYGNKELDQMHGMNIYDSQARMYFPDLPRTITPDPLAEKYYNISPYVYCADNPVNAVDPDGRDPKNPYKYNWTTGNYQDTEGDVVSWSEVQSWLLDVSKGFQDIYRTIKNKLSPQPEALKSDLVTTMDFFTGAGPEKRDFGWETASSKSLKDSYMTTVALKRFMEKYRNEPSKQFQLITIGFSPLEGADVGPVESAQKDMGYSTAQFVGSCDYNITIIGDHLNITVTNTTSLKSALYHIPFIGKPSREETPLGIGGNIDQTFRFTIPLDEAKIRANQ